MPLIDIGLRLVDAEDMALQSERVTVSDWQARVGTLRRHGATEPEINFLRSHRIELNAMTSRQFIDFIEAKLIEHGVRKVLPELSTIEVHARRLIEQHLARAALASIRHQVAADAANYVLPDLEARLEACLEQNPELPWDDALGQLIAETLG